MRKEFIIIGGIIAFIIGMHAWSQWYVNIFFDGVIQDMDSIEKKILSNQFEEGELEKNIDLAMKKWKSRYDFYACFLEHDELEKVDNQLVCIKANIVVGDFDKGVEEIERCKFFLRHIEDKDSMRVVNIF